MAIAGDESGTLTVSQRDQVVVIEILTADRRRSLGIRNDLGLTAQQVEVEGPLLPPDFAVAAGQDEPGAQDDRADAVGEAHMAIVSGDKNRRVRRQLID